MIDRRLAAAAAIGIVGVTLVVVFLTTDPLPGTGTPAGTIRPIATPAAAPSRDPMAPLQDAVTVVDGSFDDRVERTVRSPTRHKNQSKLFFADGSWWGVLREPTTREARIQRLDWATQRWHDTGVVVDERPFSSADVLYADDRLYVASAGSSESPTHAVRVSRYAYEPDDGRWALDADFPVTITPAGVESVVIDRASDGTLWVAYIAAGDLFVSHSVGGDHRWVAPYRPPVAGRSVTADQVGMAAAAGEIVLLWSNQDDEAIYATSHRDSDPDDVWAEATTVVSGLAVADNHVNVKALPDGRVYAVAKTSLDTVPRNQPGWDQILVLDRSTDGWRSTQFGQIRDRHTRPIVVLDGADRQVMVFATAPTAGGAIYMKATSFDDVRFTTGRGAAVLETSAAPRVNDATSTKQPLDATTGIVVLAADDDIGRYVHMAASLGGPAPGRPDDGAPPDGPEPAPGGPIDLVRDDFDAFDVETPVQATWRTAPNRSDGTVGYVERAAGDLAVRARTGGPGELRPCRTFGATSVGAIEVAADVRLDAQGASDTVLLMVRGSGEELGSIRVDDQLRFRVSELGDRETTDLRIRPGDWYRITFVLDTAARSFDVRIADARGATLLERTERPWRDAEAIEVDAVCVAASRGRAGLGVTFDAVRVTRDP